jgi:hypothetical protein
MSNRKNGIPSQLTYGEQHNIFIRNYLNPHKWLPIGSSTFPVDQESIAARGGQTSLPYMIADGCAGLPPRSESLIWMGTERLNTPHL